MPSPSGKTVSRREKDVAWIALGVLVILGSVLFPAPKGERLTLDSDGKIFLPRVCWLKRATGIDCAGCGLTRSFVAMGHLDPVAAWRFHRMGPALYGIVLFTVFYHTVRVLARWKGRRAPELSRRFQERFFLAVLVLLLANWVHHLATGAAFC